MTLAADDSEHTYTGNGSTTAFDGPRVFDAEHIQVYLTTYDDAASGSTGEGTTTLLTSGYTLSRVGPLYTACQVTFDSAPAASDGISIRRVVPYEQDTSIRSQGVFLPEIHENALDKLVMMIQQLATGSMQLGRDPDSGAFVWDARGYRIRRVGDAVSVTDATNLQTVLRLIEESGTGQGMVVSPQLWEFDGDGQTRDVMIPGADVSDPLFYDVFLQGSGQEPYDDYSIVMGADTSETLLRFATAPAADTHGWIVLRGYARPYAGEAPVTTLDLPIIQISGPAAELDATNRWALIECLSDVDTVLTIPANSGGIEDWEKGSWFTVRQVGEGQVSVQAPQLSTLPGFLGTTRGTGSVITCTCVDANTNSWMLTGDLTREAVNPELQVIAIPDRSVLIGDDVTTGTNKGAFVLPFGLLLSSVADRGLYASLSTAQVSGSALTVDVKRNGTSILQQKLSFDNGEKTTLTAALPATLVNGGNVLYAGDEIVLDVGQIGDTGAKGLTLYLVGQRA